MTDASVTKNAPHPNAARLFVEFLVSKKGSSFSGTMTTFQSIPMCRLGTLILDLMALKFRAVYMTPEEIELGMTKWTKFIMSFQVENPCSMAGYLQVSGSSAGSLSI